MDPLRLRMYIAASDGYVFRRGCGRVRGEAGQRADAVDQRSRLSFPSWTSGPGNRAGDDPRRKAAAASGMWRTIHPQLESGSGYPLLVPSHLEKKLGKQLTFS